MFGTLRYNPNSKDTQFVERSDGISELGGSVPPHAACESCRAKKVNFLESHNDDVANMETIPIFSSGAMVKKTVAPDAPLRLAHVYTQSMVADENDNESKTPTRKRYLQLVCPALGQVTVLVLYLCILGHHRTTSPQLYLEHHQW